MKVSVCMIVKNEEVNIARALKSIPDHYETIVVDTGSSDKTKAIAKALGAQVYDHEWCEDFAWARNMSCFYATGDYILILDADEQLGDNVDETIRNHVLQCPEEPGAVLIENDTDEGVTRHRMIRFFPNLPKFNYIGIVHEQLFNGDLPASYVPMELVLYHYGYMEEQYYSHQKEIRYISLYEKHLKERPDDGYMLYQFGKLYYSIGQLESAKHYLIKGIEQQERNRLYFPVMLVMYGYVLKEQGKVNEAEHLISQYVVEYPEYPDLFFLQGMLAMETGNVQQIERSYLHALTIGETTKYSSVAGVGTFKAAFNLGLFYEMTGQLAKAKEYYNISSNYSFKPALERLFFLS
ncbi:family 2 glycosyl transferase [Paenibacillus selenitireducens]|uniref:Family 2 glycosyl transferase n=1 Tax=Paenibacillus selenitireducens TaxID=1324314 RepID=A0A1T2X6Z5_9BACL|nr:glycosyltransferase family 2 protein [Paenibacillus selenitireducens]OPA75658.1 family 2 glycosyl transferase [Paenibacillus selenitireducens]